MNILVVGGAGYIGSHAVRFLLAAGHRVTVYDNLSRGHRESIPDDSLVVGELTDREKLVGLLRDRGIEAVMHFAAFALVNESVSNPSEYYCNNVIASLELLEAMKEAGVRKIVFSSTTATYGEADTMPISEDAPQRPISPYGFTKLVIERALSDYANAYGFGYVALRYFNAAGAHPDGTIGEDHDPESHLIPVVLQVALGQRESITIYGDDFPTPDGTCLRDYIHVDDLARGHVAALDYITRHKGVEAVNLGAGKGISVLEMVQAFEQASGVSVPLHFAPRRPGDLPQFWADASKAKRLLNWEVEKSLTDMCADVWRWQSQNPEGYGDQ